MDTTFTPEIALTALKIISPLVVIIATYLTSRTDIKTEYKLGISLLISFLLAILTAYSENKLSGTGNLWDNLFYIFTLAQGIYAVVFKAAGLEKRLYAKEAVASIAAQQAKTALASLTTDEAKALLEPSASLQVHVTSTATLPSKTLNDV